MAKKVLAFFIGVLMILTQIYPVQAKTAQKSVVPPKLTIVTQPKSEYSQGERISFTVTSPNYTGKVEYRVILFNGTTKKTTDLWPKSPGGYYKGWQPAGNYKFQINWPIENMVPGSYSITVYVRRVGSTGKYDSYVSTKSFAIKANGFIKVHYIDIGLGDSILVQTSEGKNMLIDAASNKMAPVLLDYLAKQGVKKIDVLVGTHDHDDHLGGLDDVIKNFEIGKVYLSKTYDKSADYQNAEEALTSKKITAVNPAVGDSIELGSGIKIKVMGPNKNYYDDDNNYSIVLKLTYGEKSFLFTGDAGEASELEMVGNNEDIRADVLKVGHHGSRYSSTDEFINKVNPKYAVISVGKDNWYDYPHMVTVNKLKNKGISVYRTDESGTIIATCDGKNINFNVKPGQEKYNPEQDKNNPLTIGIDNKNPKQLSMVYLTIKGPVDHDITTICHFKTGDIKYSSKILKDGTVTIPIPVGEAEAGYEVQIEVQITYEGKTYTSRTSFTPEKR